MKERIINILRLLCSFILFMYMSTFLNLILKLFGININNLSLLNKTILNLLVSIFMGIFLSFIYRKEITNDFNEFKYNWKNKLLFSLKLFGIFMLFKFLAGYVSVIFFTVFNIEQITSDNQSTINDLLGQYPLLMSLSAVVIAPYYEEILFRLGFKKCFNNKLIFILLSGVLFGLIHIFPTDLHMGVALIQSISYVSMGLCLSYYYNKYNNIFYSILVHFYNNLFSVIFILTSYLIDFI